MEPDFHHRVHTSSLLAPILSQKNPVHIIQTYFCNIHLNIILQTYMKWLVSYLLELPPNLNHFNNT
jgi:hypothetical protein